ncbi:MAG: MBL fold metallo-hydrolase [Syntrophomonadaceae bacterium]|nr:MBL fold metallo-hydrolase [Syntrophomonadaceae bacterium]MDD3024064.1 MBL fold metallo-hydrolase [Syntrophomonadaceae bacterium]
MYHTIIPIFNGFFSIDFGNMLKTPASYWPFNPQIANSPSFIFLIIDEQGDKILVDTGFSKDYVFGYPPFSSYQRDINQELPKALASRGIIAENINQVILTHIHWDHTGGIGFFPKATFYCQAEEFRVLFRLLPNEETGYCPSHWLPYLERIKLVEGNMEIKPGIKLILSGGHTAGHQMVEVNTRLGKVLLGGDIRFDYSPMWQVPQENWDVIRQGPGKKMFWSNEVLPIIKDWLESNSISIESNQTVQPFQKSSDHHQILFSHDSELLKIKSIP